MDKYTININGYNEWPKSYFRDMSLSSEVKPQTTKVTD